MKVVLVANTDLSRTKGLMFHQGLQEDECAFFDFPITGKHFFWNKNVDFPISLIFCGKNGEVKDVKYLQAQQTESVSPDSYDIKYVIEAHVDAPKKHGIGKGKIMKFKEKEVSFE